MMALCRTRLKSIKARNRGDEMYIMLKELETPFKINKFIYALDLFILIGFAGIGVALQGMVFSKLQMVFFVFNFLVGCFLTAPSFANPQKRNFQSLFLLLRKTQNKTVYHSMPVEYSRAEVIDFREKW